MTSQNNILLVEDNADDRDLTIMVLKDSKIANEIDIARDGEEALQYFEDQSRPLPALVLLDLKLPKIMGLDVLKRLRADERTKLVPIVVLTSSQRGERSLPKLRRRSQRLRRQAGRVRRLFRGRQGTRTVLARDQRAAARSRARMNAPRTAAQPHRRPIENATFCSPEKRRVRRLTPSTLRHPGPGRARFAARRRSSSAGDSQDQPASFHGSSMVDDRGGCGSREAELPTDGPGASSSTSSRCDGAGLDETLVGWREVTERTRVERAVRESEQRLRAAVDTQLDPFAIYSAVRDSAGRVVDVRTEFINRAACEFSQITAEDQLGRGLLELFPELASSRIFELYREVIETGESFAHDGLELNALFGGVAGPRHYDVRIVRRRRWCGRELSRCDQSRARRAASGAVYSHLRDAVQGRRGDRADQAAACPVRAGLPRAGRAGAAADGVGG